MKSPFSEKVIYKSGYVNSFLIGIFAATFIFGLIYFIWPSEDRGVKTAIITAKEEYDQNDLLVAEDDYKEASTELNNLIKRSNAQKPIINQIENQYLRINDSILQKTDSLFNNPDTNPEIKVGTSNKKLNDDINSRRQKIKETLDAWNNTITSIRSDSNNRNSPTLIVLVQNAKNDITKVREYVSELQNLVNSLTPANSGLSQTEINSYVAVVQSAQNDINSAVQEMATIQNSINNVVQNPQSAVLQPVVTAQEIANQQTVVSDASQQVTIIETAIAQQPNIPDIIPENTYIPTPSSIYFDTSGWPDQFIGEGFSGPLLLEGSNKK